MHRSAIQVKNKLHYAYASTKRPFAMILLNDMQNRVKYMRKVGLHLAL